MLYCALAAEEGVVLLLAAEEGVVLLLRSERR